MNFSVTASELKIIKEALTDKLASQRRAWIQLKETSPSIAVTFAKAFEEGSSLLEKLNAPKIIPQKDQEEKSRFYNNVK